MNPNPSNRNIILVSAAIACISLIYGISNFKKAFPEIAVNFQISKSEVLNIASDFLSSRNFEMEDYRTSVVFAGDNSAKVFLERELGVERTVSLTQDSLDIWYWSVRVFRPLQKLEYRVRVSPAGDVLGFERKIMEDMPGPSLEQENARIMAEAFLTGPIGIDLEKWEPVESSSVDLPARKDYNFEYELTGFKAAEAPYRLKIEVQGATVGSFSRYLKVPQNWRRDYERLRERNNIYQLVTQVFMLLLFIAVIVHFIRHIKLNQIHWKPILWLSGILTGLIFLVALNSIPLAEAGYLTTDSYGAFIGKILIFGLLGGLIQGVFVLLLLGAGEFIYRQDHPQKLFLGGLLSRRGIRTREFIQATLMGYILAAFHIGFVVFYYIVGKKIGFWSPAEINYTDAVSTVAPWLYPLAISVMAAFSEEFMFRYFGISFLRRFLRSLPLAIILQAFIWGFLHSAYPQQPGFARGIEVGLIGIAAGVIMWRFGIWATLTWHFVIDAILIGLFLFRSTNAYFWVSGLIVCGGLAVPAIFAAVHYFRKRGFEKADDLLNEAIQQPTFAKPKESAQPDPETPLPSEVSYTPLAKSTRRAALIIGIAGILIATLPGSRNFGDSYYPRVDRIEAVEIAKKAVMERYDIDPDKYLIGASHPRVRQDALAYTRKNTDLKSAEKIILDPGGVDNQVWFINFKREFEAEFYQVKISMMTGEAYPYHILADTTASANLTIDSARVLAVMAFEETEAIPDLYNLIEEKSEEKENRIDHTFTWETVDPILSDPQYGDANYRRIVKIIGDEVEPHDRYLHLPEQWTRHEDEKSGFWPINLALFIVLILGFGIYAVVSFGKQVARREIVWRNGIICGLIVAALTLLQHWNGWVSIWTGYRTATPTASHVTTELIVAFTGVMFASLFIVLVIALSEALIRSRYQHSAWTFPQIAGRQAGEDGILLILGIVGVMFASAWLINGMETWLHMPVHSWSYFTPESLTDYLPWGGVFADSVHKAILLGGLLITGFILIERGIRKSWLRWLLMALTAVILAGPVFASQGNLSTSEIAWRAVKLFINISLIYAVLKYWIRERLWVLISAIFIWSTVKTGMGFVSWTYSPYPTQGWVLIILTGLTITWLLYVTLKGRDKTDSAT